MGPSSAQKLRILQGHFLIKVQWLSKGKQLPAELLISVDPDLLRTPLPGCRSHRQRPDIQLFRLSKAGQDDTIALFLSPGNSLGRIRVKLQMDALSLPLRGRKDLLPALRLQYRPADLRARKKLQKPFRLLLSGSGGLNPQIQLLHAVKQLRKPEIQSVAAYIFPVDTKGRKAFLLFLGQAALYDAPQLSVRNYHLLRAQIHGGNSMAGFKDDLSVLPARRQYPGSSGNGNQSLAALYRLELYIAPGCADRLLYQAVEKVQILNPVLFHDPSVSLLTGREHLPAQIRQSRTRIAAPRLVGKLRHIGTHELLQFFVCSILCEFLFHRACSSSCYSSPIPSSR